MHLQCFTPTRYVMGVSTRTYERDDHYPTRSKLQYGCLLAMCGPIMPVPTLCAAFWVPLPALHCYTLKSKLFSVLHCKASRESNYGV